MSRPARCFRRSRFCSSRISRRRSGGRAERKDSEIGSDVASAAGGSDATSVAGSGTDFLGLMMLPGLATKLDWVRVDPVANLDVDLGGLPLPRPVDVLCFLVGVRFSFLDAKSGFGFRGDWGSNCCCCCGCRDFDLEASAW